MYDDTLKVMDIKNNNIKTVIVEKKTYTPWFVVRHKVDWYILDAVSARKVYPPGGGFTASWNDTLTTIPGQVWPLPVNGITGIT